MYEFTKEANKLVNTYVETTRKKIINMDSDRDIDKLILEIFLSDIEDDIKFLAIQLSRSRGSQYIEKRDVNKALRKLIIELLRSYRIFAHHNRKFLRDVYAINERRFLNTPQILDVGCGWGIVSRRLSKFLDDKAEIVGIDLDISSMEYGKLINRNISFLRSHGSHITALSS